MLRTLNDDGLIQRAEVLGTSLRRGIESLNHRLVDHVRGRGLLCGVALTGSAAKAVEAARAQGRFPCQRRRARRYPAGAAAGDHRRPSRPVHGELARCAGPSRRMMRTPAAWNSSGSHRQTLVAFHQNAPLDALFHVNSVVRHIDALRGSADPPLIGENV